MNAPAMPSPEDRDAFEALVVRHQVAICAVAYSVLRDAGRSEEVAQEALLIAWRDRARVEVTAGWICGVARNLARNAARRHREVALQHEHEPATQTDARDALIAHEDAARASAALDDLPEKYRDALAIYYRSDESYAEVAAALGITAAAARQRVHRGRERLRERLSIVEATLRATRPGPAFIATAIATWELRRSAPAAAAAVGASNAPWLASALGVGAIVLTIAIVIVRSASTDRSESRGATMSTSTAAATATAAPRGSHAPVARRFPLMARVSATTPPALPRGFTPAFAPPRTPGGPMRTVEFDFTQAPIEDLLQLLAHETEIPMWSMLEPTRVDIHVKDVPALDALDQILSQAHAVRTEVDAIRIVEHGPSDAATLGGDLMSISVRAVPLNAVLALVEPKLAIPIARVGTPFRALTLDGQVIDDPSPPVTLDLTDMPAGLVLQRALEQVGYGYEPTTGFVITPE